MPGLLGRVHACADRHAYAVPHTLARANTAETLGPLVGSILAIPPGLSFSKKLNGGPVKIPVQFKVWLACAFATFAVACEGRVAETASNDDERPPAASQNGGEAPTYQQSHGCPTMRSGTTA